LSAIKALICVFKNQIEEGGQNWVIGGRTIKVLGGGIIIIRTPPPPNKNIEMSQYGDLIIFAFTLLFSFLFHLFSLCLFLFHLFPFASLFTLFLFTSFCPSKSGVGHLPTLPPPLKTPLFA